MKAGVKWTWKFCLLAVVATSCSYSSALEVVVKGKGIKSPYGIVEDGELRLTKERRIRK